MNTANPQDTAAIGILGSGARIRGVLKRLVEAGGGRIAIRAAYDPNPPAVQVTRELFGDGVEICDSEEALLNHPDISWVFIGSVNNLHKRHILGALKAGKHVFAEKPLATTFEDCLAIRDAVAASDRTFALGLVLRYSALYQKVKSVLDSGVLGELLSAEFNETLSFNHGGFIFGDWRRSQELSGGHMLEKCCHDLDLAGWFVGSVPIRIASFGGRRFFVPENAGRMDEIGPNEKGLDAYRSWETATQKVLNPFTSGADIHDHQVAILEYANGVRATFHTNCNAGIPERRILLLGSKGALRADLVAGTVEVGKIGWDGKPEIVFSNATDGHGGGDDIMARELCRTMLEGLPPYASVREGLVSAVTAFAMDQSLNENRIVDLLPMWKSARL